MWTPQKAKDSFKDDEGKNNTTLSIQVILEINL